MPLPEADALLAPREKHYAFPGTKGPTWRRWPAWPSTASGSARSWVGRLRRKAMRGAGLLIRRGLMRPNGLARLSIVYCST
jgi:hypothetical protein